MGKKRRLNCAKAKFSAKLANHPRNKLLIKMQMATEEADVVEELLIEAEPTKVEKPAEAPTLTAPETPKPKKRNTRAKKTTTSTTKRSTSTRKRAPKKKTTSATA